MMDNISILIPCRNEEKYIESCLQSVVNSDYPKKHMEVIVLDGMSSDRTQHIITLFSQQYDYIKYILNPDKTVPSALNLGVKVSSGDFIIRLDAHSKYPVNYFTILIYHMKKLNADNVGTTIKTDVLNKNPKSIAISKVLGNKFGVGNSLFRTGTDKILEVDTVPFGCYRKEVFQIVGFFNELLIRDQDIEFNKRLKTKGGKIFLIPRINLIYYARETFADLAKNNYQTGFWNILTVYITKNIRSLSLRHFIPLIFTLLLIVPLMITTLYPISFYFSLIIGTVYVFVLFVVAFKIVDETTTIFNILLSFFVLHLSYGFGSLIGLLRIDYIFRKSRYD